MATRTFVESAIADGHTSSADDIREKIKLTLATMPERNLTPDNTTEQIAALQADNNRLSSYIVAMRDELLLATQTTLGRMLIEVGIAANDLRDSLPQDELEEGEVQGAERGKNRWKLRLDSMIQKIDEFHKKAHLELSEVGRKMDGMKQDAETSNSSLPETNLQGTKRSWASIVRTYNAESDKENNPPKRPRDEDKHIGLHAQVPDNVSTRTQITSLPLQPIQLNQINRSTVRSDISQPPALPIHEDRQKIMQDVKMEELKGPKLAAYPRSFKLKSKWKAAAQRENVTAEETGWLFGVKTHWTRGGWESREIWLKHVMAEYRMCKFLSKAQSEMDREVGLLSFRISSGNFRVEDFPGLGS